MSPMIVVYTAKKGSKGKISSSGYQKLWWIQSSPFTGTPFSAKNTRGLQWVTGQGREGRHILSSPAMKHMSKRRSQPCICTKPLLTNHKNYKFWEKIRYYCFAYCKMIKMFRSFIFKCLNQQLHFWGGNVIFGRRSGLVKSLTHIPYCGKRRTLPHSETWGLDHASWTAPIWGIRDAWALFCPAVFLLPIWNRSILPPIWTSAWWLCVIKSSTWGSLKT